MKFSTKAIHAGQAPDPATGAVVGPIYQTSTFVFEDLGQSQKYSYSRWGNPTRSGLEECLAALEEAKFGLAFSSGMAAADAVLSVLRPGDHVVACRDLYGGTFRLFESVYVPRQIGVTYVDAADVEAFSRAVQPNTRLAWIETPTNPLLRLADIQALSRCVQGRNVFLVVDNTFASPFFQKPLTLGADVVVHSTTKYIGGHSDVLGGAILTSRPELYEAFKSYQQNVGAVPGPFDCWLTLRGVKTLAVRMGRHEQNAGRIAGFLAGHPQVKRVFYPGLPGHPQHALARRQMSGYGGIVTFQVPGGLEEAGGFCKTLNIFHFAVSLGGVESLVCHPATMSHAAMPREDREKIGITDGTIRLSVGIEDADDLIGDVDQALGALSKINYSVGRIRDGVRLTGT